jgi:YfiH family protein
VRLSPPFHPVEDHIGIELPGGRALFTTRRGGVSVGPFASLNLGRSVVADTDREAVDQSERVAANRALLAEHVGLPPERFAQGRQVHGTTVVRVRGGQQLGMWGNVTGPALDPSDGQATALTGAAVLVLVADCLPVALIAPGAVAVVHAGWRGLAGGIVREGVAAIRELGADGPITAAIGPGARRCCYEVGEDVRAVFERHGPRVRDGRRLDLAAIAALELRDAGVEEVHDVGLCTICEDPSLFFSHRRDRGVTGRQAGVAWRS